MQKVIRRMSSSSRPFAFTPAKRLEPFEHDTVWHEFTPLANKFKAMNLGQGFPNWNAPDFVKEAANTAVASNANQYARSAGHLRLVNTLAERYSKRLGRTVDPLTQVLVTCGATGGMYNVMQALVNPGDEVIVFEPAFDIYSAQVLMAGGTPKYVPLRPPTDGGHQWTFDVEELRAAFTPKTKAIILNTPHNPLGVVMTQSQLESIAQAVTECAPPSCVVVSDEVYEHITFDGRKHASFANLDGMWERTITVSSAGKTFSVTGWKIGWVVGPSPLVHAVDLVNQWTVFSVPTPLQEAVAIAIERADLPYEGFPTYYDWLRDMYSKKREMLADALRAAGMNPIMPSGGFFIVADTSNVQVPEEFLQDELNTKMAIQNKDYVFCRWLTSKIGVTAIPPSAFFSEANKGIADNLARFAFCKTDETLEEAARRLAKCKEFCVKH